MPPITIADNKQNRQKAIRDAAFNQGVKSITAATGTITAGDPNWIMCGNTTLQTLNLDPASTMTFREIIVKDAVGTANTNNIVIDAYGSETIDGATTKTISTSYGVVRLRSNGTAWFTVK